MINIIIVVIRHNHKINLIKAEILWRCAVLIDIHDYVSSLCSVAKLNGHQEPYTIANVHYSIRTRILCQHCCGHANRILCNFSVLYSELVFDHANERWKHGLHWPPLQIPPKTTTYLTSLLCECQTKVLFACHKHYRGSKYSYVWS